MTDKRETYTAKECAERLGLDPNTLRNLIRTKQVPFGIAVRQPSGAHTALFPRPRSRSSWPRVCRWNRKRRCQDGNPDQRQRNVFNHIIA